jgi:mannose-6-phosphate isomerase
MTEANGVHALVQLRPVVMDYAWGIRGMDSRVGRYALESKILKEVDPDTPYAELWIGTHDKGPSILNDGSERTLKEAIGKDLPFLFKVLSAGKALSIQAHPDKPTAVRLNKDNPSAYGDGNHKPEMAIALTPFEAMCGFRRLEEIALLLKKHPEFAACISQEAKLAVFLAETPEAQKGALQKLFSSFMGCDPSTSKTNLKKLLDRLQTEQSAFHPHPHDEPAWERKCARAILRLAQQFPGDTGAMSPLFLNYLLIAPGESFFMAANEPHAYVAGEIIECMACSDNVVRAGLTPKFKDVDNLVNMLTYSMGGPSIDVGEPHTDDHRILRYTPPVPEFEVMILSLDPGDMCKLKHPGVPAILLVLEGAGKVDGQNLRPGLSYYWAADTATNVEQGADVAGGAAPATLDGAIAASLKSLTFTVDEHRQGPLKVAIAHANLHVTRPTSFRRSESNNSLSNLGHMPYMGRSGGSPSPRYLKETYEAVTDGTPLLPSL